MTRVSTKKVLVVAALLFSAVLCDEGAASSDMCALGLEQLDDELSFLQVPVHKPGSDRLSAMDEILAKKLEDFQRLVDYAVHHPEHQEEVGKCTGNSASCGGGREKHDEEVSFLQSEQVHKPGSDRSSVGEDVHSAASAKGNREHMGKTGVPNNLEKLDKNLEKLDETVDKKFEKLEHLVEFASHNPASAVV